jgi:hypothetical protein
MSCEQNIRCEEACFEAFCDLLHNNSHIEQDLFNILLEYDVDANLNDFEERFFDILWKYDPEGMYYDMKEVIKQYKKDKCKWKK